MVKAEQFCGGGPGGASDQLVQSSRLAHAFRHAAADVTLRLCTVGVPLPCFGSLVTSIAEASGSDTQRETFVGSVRDGLLTTRENEIAGVPDLFSSQSFSGDQA